jgi:hypothetical protein
MLYQTCLNTHTYIHTYIHTHTCGAFTSQAGQSPFACTSPVAEGFYAHCRIHLCICIYIYICVCSHTCIVYAHSQSRTPWSSLLYRQVARIHNRQIDPKLPLENRQAGGLVPVCVCVCVCVCVYAHICIQSYVHEFRNMGVCE